MAVLSPNKTGKSNDLTRYGAAQEHVQQCAVGTPLRYPGALPEQVCRVDVPVAVGRTWYETSGGPGSGHKTESTYERYNITSREDLEQAAVQVQRYLDMLPVE